MKANYTALQVAQWFMNDAAEVVFVVLGIMAVLSFNFQALLCCVAGFKACRVWKAKVWPEGSATVKAWGRQAGLWTGRKIFGGSR
jgi:hypothetical protein